MEIATPEFLAACRKVLADDRPATVLKAIRKGDPRMDLVHALAARDPAQWFCSAFDHDNVPRVWSKGATEQEARKQAKLAVT
jgi:hypothetical protein